MPHHLPIYSKQHLHDAIPQFFQRVSQFRNAKTHLPIGEPKPAPLQELSYFIARIGHRTPVRVKARQHSVRGDRDNIYLRTYWRHSHYSYGVFSLAWSSEAPELVSEHATKAEALRALTSL